MDLPLDVDAAWQWTWPALVTLAWWTLVVVGSRRFFAWFGRRWADRTLVDDVAVRRLRTLTVAGGLVVGVYLFVLLAPVSDEVDQFLVDRVEPWFWWTIALIGWVVGGVWLARRVVAAFAARAARTSADVDDALAAAMRRPLTLGVLVLGVVLWASVVPLGGGVRGTLHLVAKAGAVLLAVMFLDGFFQSFLRRREKGSRVLETSGGVVRTALKLLLYTLGILTVLSAVGIDVTPVLASLGIGSLAIGLALQKTLEDFLAGLLIAADQPVRVGDFVELESGEAGWVLSIGWRTTRIRTRDDMHVIVPNGRLAQATLVNRSMPTTEVSFTVPVGVHYDTDLDRAAQVALDVAQKLQAEDPRAVLQYAPRLVYEEFADSSINFRMWLRAKSWEQHFGLKDTFIRHLQRRFHAEGIVIPFPIRTLDVPKNSPLLLRHVDPPPPAEGPGGGGPTGGGAG